MAHPAAQAWHELYPDTKPVQVAPLKVRRQKNRIYRIVLAGRPPVIAKRCGRPTALIERAVGPRQLRGPAHLAFDLGDELFDLVGGGNGLLLLNADQ